jgi:hypothetical protein
MGNSVPVMIAIENDYVNNFIIDKVYDMNLNKELEDCTTLAQILPKVQNDVLNLDLH